MLKTFAAAALAAVSFVGLALAEGPAGHTYAVTTADESWETTFADDGTFTDTRGLTGTWTYADGELCLTMSTAEGDAQICNTFNALEVGGSSTSTGWTDDGSALTITRTA